MNLDELKESKNYAAVKTAENLAVHAEFTINGAESLVSLHSESDITKNIERLRYINAILSDRTKISFLSNFGKYALQHYRNEEKSFSIDLHPGWIAVGHRHFGREDKIGKISILTDDAASIYYDFDAFGQSLDPKIHIESLISTDEARINRKIQRGDSPEIAYFAGKCGIFSVDSVIGRISAEHNVEHSISGPRGVFLRNHIYNHIDFDEPVSLFEAFDRIGIFLRFLEVIAGRRQNINHILIYVGENNDEIPLEFYWCLWRGRSKVGREPNPTDLPINGGINPADFAGVLARWIEKDSSRKDARLRFSEGFSKQNYHSIDRLIAAANMFDILPSDAIPSTIKLEPDLIDARIEARRIFRGLPQSPERDSILNALGRIGKNNLKQKIRYRANILLSGSESKFPDLMIVIDEAVNCRNHYVHGSESDIDYTKNFATLIAYFTNTLEFIFSSSDFLESGWNFDKWRSNGTTMSHPWGEYVVTYDENLRILRACMGKK